MAPAVPQPLLELHSTSVIIDGSVVVDRVSLTVGRGEFVLLRGPTGSGKSTVLKLLAGLVRPTSGEVIVAGDRVDHFNEMERRWLRRSMGLMMQDGRLLDDRTVHENVMLPALAAEESYAEARRRGFLALEKCGLAEHADAFPARLSAGQRQLALLARFRCCSNRKASRRHRCLREPQSTDSSQSPTPRNHTFHARFNGC